MFSFGCYACGAKWDIGAKRTCTCPEEPDASTWVDLTNKEFAEILCDDRWQMRPELMLLACQAKLKEKNERLV